MADWTERVSEVMAPLIIEYPDAFGPSIFTSSYVSLMNYHRAWLLLVVGELQATATLDVQLLQATTTAGAGAKVITGKAITQLGAADDDSICCIELRSEEMDVANAFDCVAVRHTVANANVELSYVLFGCVPRFARVTQTAWTEVVP